MLIDAEFLIAPGSGSNKEKFYVGVLHDKAPICLYGPVSAGAAGTITEPGQKADVRAKLNEKKRGKYVSVDPSRLSKVAQINLITNVASRLGLDPNGARLTPQGIDFGQASAGQTPRPRRSAKQVHHWI